MTSATKPRAACLIGWPAAHSRSPLIHHYWLRTLGIEGGYNIEAVPPEGFAEFVLHFSAHGFVGAKVTIPPQERALALSQPPARAGNRRRPASVACCCRRSGLRAAGNPVAGRGAGAGTEDRRRAWHAAASGGARLRIMVRPEARSHARTARAGRGRSHKRMIASC